VGRKRGKMGRSFKEEWNIQGPWKEEKGKITELTLIGDEYGRRRFEYKKKKRKKRNE